MCLVIIKFAILWMKDFLSFLFRTVKVKVTLLNFNPSCSTTGQRIFSLPRVTIVILKYKKAQRKTYKKRIVNNYLYKFTYAVKKHSQKSKEQQPII